MTQSRLFDFPLSEGAKPLLETAKNDILMALNGQSNQFFFTVDDVMNRTPLSKQAFYKLGKSRLEQYADENKWKKSEELLETLTEDYASLFGALEYFVFVGVKLDFDKSFPSSLYTRNLVLLKKWYDNGNLLVEDFSKIEKHLKGTKTRNGVAEGTFCTVRLDFQGMQGKKPIFKPTVPQSNMEIGIEKEHVFIPIQFFYTFEDLLNQTIQSNPFRFVKESIINGQPQNMIHVATLSQNTVLDIYAGNDAKLVQNKLAKTKVGYDPINLRFYAYDLEASLHSSGSASFRPEMLNLIQPVTKEEIDTSRHNVDGQLLRAVFITRVKGLNKTQLENLNFINISGYANMRDQIEAIQNHLDNVSDKDLFYFMKNNPITFGDLQVALEKRQRLTAKFLKNLKAISLPTDAEKRKELIEDLLKRGVVKFIATKTNGTPFERSISNNEEVLKRLLGDDYFAMFETPRNRLYKAKEEIETQKIGDSKALLDIGTHFNILKEVDQVLFSSGYQGALSAIDAVIEELKEKTKNRAYNESSLTYRNIFATSPKNYYGQVNVETITSLEFSEV